MEGKKQIDISQLTEEQIRELNEERYQLYVKEIARLAHIPLTAGLYQALTSENGIPKDLDEELRQYHKDRIDPEQVVEKWI